jgi:pimeloyl-ACP methyl ester carboxylesterase
LPADVPLVAEPLRLRAADGTALAADVRPVAGADTAVVVVHGFGGRRHHEAVVALGDALHAAGHAVLSLDLRGHGESSGLCTLGDLERHDVCAAVVAARELAPRVVVVGASMGAIAALRHAVDDDDLSGVVTVSSPARWRLHTPRTVAAALVTRTRVGRRLGCRLGVRLVPTWRLGAAPERLAARMATPLAVVHGTADRFMPAGEATRLHAAATGRCRLDVIEGMGHAFDPAGTAAIVAGVAWCLADSDPLTVAQARDSTSSA